MTTDTILSVLASKPLSQLSESEMREARSLAMSILRADYYADVRSTAASIIEAIKDKEVTSMDELSDRIHEDCDSAARVIYTSQAQEALLLSDNASAFVDEFGEEGIVRDGDINWSALAYAAFAADVREELESEGIDDSSFDEEEDEEEAEEEEAEDEETSEDA